MIFKEWLLLNENIGANFDDWLKAIVKYAKPSFRYHNGDDHQVLYRRHD